MPFTVMPLIIIISHKNKNSKDYLYDIRKFIPVRDHVSFSDKGCRKRFIGILYKYYKKIIKHLKNHEIYGTINYEYI